MFRITESFAYLQYLSQEWYVFRRNRNDDNVVSVKITSKKPKYWLRKVYSLFKILNDWLEVRLIFINITLFRRNEVTLSLDYWVSCLSRLRTTWRNCASVERRVLISLQAWSTVPWSLPPKASPISLSVEPVISRARNIATWRG